MKIEFAIHTSGLTDSIPSVEAWVFLGRHIEFHSLEGQDGGCSRGQWLEGIVEQEIPKPTDTDAQNLAKWKKCVVKARQIILEGVQDHIVSSLHGKETPHYMLKTCIKIEMIKGSWHWRINFVKSRWRKARRFWNTWPSSLNVRMNLEVFESQFPRRIWWALLFLDSQRVGVVIRTLSMVSRSYQLECPKLSKFNKLN